MEVLRGKVPIPQDIIREIPVICDWENIDKIYKVSLNHPFADRHHGFIPYGYQEESGWITTRSQVEIDNENFALRRLQLTHTDTPLKIAFVAIGLPVPWHKQWAYEKVVRRDSRNNTVWVQPPYLKYSLETAQKSGSLAIEANANKLSTTVGDKVKTIPIVEVNTPQPLSSKKAMRTLNRTSRLLRQTTGYVHPQRYPKARNKYRRSFSGFSPAR